MSVYAAMLVAGLAVTYCWRFAGVLVARRLDAESDLLLWVRAVATALVAALCMRIVLFPAGLLAETALWVRLAAMAAGLVAFFAVNRRAEAGVAAGVLTMLLGQGLFG